MNSNTIRTFAFSLVAAFASAGTVSAQTTAVAPNHQDAKATSVAPLKTQKTKYFEEDKQPNLAWRHNRKPVREIKAERAAAKAAARGQQMGVAVDGNTGNGRKIVMKHNRKSVAQMKAEMAASSNAAKSNGPAGGTSIGTAATTNGTTAKANSSVNAK